MSKKNALGRVGRWPGGYIRRTRGGRQVYVIERWPRGGRGKRIHLSTGATSLSAAVRELERFELDPIGYEPGGALPSGLLLTPELIAEYHEHQVTSGLTTEWAREVSRCLIAWIDAIGGRDLRALKLHRDLLPSLDRWKTQRPHRIKAIKGLCRWLRQSKGLLERNQDATIDLLVPQAKAEKLSRRKVVAPEHVEAVLHHLPAKSRDILHLLTATAWHVSEARRFSQVGEIATPRNADGVLAVLVTPQKNGEPTKTPVLHPEHLEVARRVLDMKKFPKRMTLARHMKTARDAAGVPYFGMGWMRHSVLTWGVEDGGASVETASEFAHHKNKGTTKKFYLDLRIPKDALPVYRFLV